MVADLLPAWADVAGFAREYGPIGGAEVGGQVHRGVGARDNERGAGPLVGAGGQPGGGLGAVGQEREAGGAHPRGEGGGGGGAGAL